VSSVSRLCFVSPNLQVRYRVLLSLPALIEPLAATSLPLNVMLEPRLSVDIERGAKHGSDFAVPSMAARIIKSADAYEGRASIHLSRSAL
jgi:hypothetical protein